MDHNLQSLTYVQNNIQTELKNLSLLFEDFIAKSNKLNSALKSTFVPLTNYLESFQKIVNFSLSTAGGSKDIGTHLSKLLTTQRNLDCHLKPVVQNLTESLNNSLSKQLDGWKKKSHLLDKSHTKKAKHAKDEYKKALSKEKKAKKNQNLVEEVQTQSQQALNSWKDVEISFIKELMLEEQTRFLAFVNSIQPFFSSQLQLVGEIKKIEEELSRFQNEFKNSEILNPHAQKLLAQYALGSVKDPNNFLKSLYLSRTLTDDLFSISSSCSFGKASLVSSVSDTTAEIKNLCLDKDEGYIGSNPGASENSLKDIPPSLNRIVKNSAENTDSLVSTNENSESESSLVSSTEDEEDEENEEKEIKTPNSKLIYETATKLDDEIQPAMSIMETRTKNNIPRHYTISGAYSRRMNRPSDKQSDRFKNPSKTSIPEDTPMESQQASSNMQKSQSNWSLYPNQALPMPVYANLAQLQQRRKLSGSESMSKPESNGLSHTYTIRRRPLLHSNSVFTDSRIKEDQQHQEFQQQQRPITLLDMDLDQFNKFTSTNNIDAINASNYLSHQELNNTEANQRSPIQHNMIHAISTPKINSMGPPGQIKAMNLIKTKSATIHHKNENSQKSGFTSRDPFSVDLENLDYAKNISVCHSSIGNQNSPDNLSLCSNAVDVPVSESSRSHNEEKYHVIPAKPDIPSQNLDNGDEDYFDLPPPPSDI